ncbi:MAG: response regulator [Myxococcaceae bacterium]|nr:response regulator [Myxococcaceae bacterium]
MNDNLAPMNAGEPVPSAPIFPSSPSIHLLLIDDDEGDRTTVRRMLQHAGIPMQITEAPDFGSAKRALTQQKADCVILDFHLPSGDGLELLQLVSTLRLDAPIVVLTGQGDETLAVDLMKAGAVDYVPKRLLTPQRLSQSVRQAIRLHQAERRAKKAHDALEHQAAQLLKLANSSLGFHAAVTVEETLELVAKLARDLIGAELAVARVDLGPPTPLLAQSRADNATLPALKGADIERWEKLIGQAGRCIAYSEQMLNDRPEWKARGILKGVLAAPLMGRDSTPVGCLLLTGTPNGEFAQGDSLMLIQLAKAASVALENSRLFKEAQDAARARDDMLAIVSHDLRNPLNVVGMSADLLRPTLKNTPDGALLTRIDRGVRRMSRLIEDLLLASRIDLGPLPVQPEKVKASLLLAEAIESAGPLADNHRVKLSALPCDTSLSVMADQERLSQVFANIIGNAVKYAPEGNGQITLSVEEENSMVRFSITDNGLGISPAALPRIFERSWKARSTERDGAGLGLYIARGIVEAHHGNISAESKPGEGTTLRFWLPIAN